MAMRWRMPREKVRTRESRRSIRPTSRSNSSARRCGIFDVLKSGEQQQILFGGQLVVDHGGMSDIAGTAVGGGRGVCAGKTQLPCRGLHDLRGDAQQRGLAGAVAPGKGHAFARCNFKRYAAQGEKSAIAFVDVLEAKSGWRYAQRSHRSFSGTAYASWRTGHGLS